MAGSSRSWHRSPSRRPQGDDRLAWRRASAARAWSSSVAMGRLLSSGFGRPRHRTPRARVASRDIDATGRPGRRDRASPKSAPGRALGPAQILPGAGLAFDKGGIGGQICPAGESVAPLAQPLRSTRPNRRQPDARRVGGASRLRADEGGLGPMATQPGMETTLRAAVAERLGESRFGLWFGEGVRLGVAEGSDSLEVAVPNAFFRDWIQGHFAGQPRRRRPGGDRPVAPPGLPGRRRGPAAAGPRRRRPPARRQRPAQGPPLARLDPLAPGRPPRGRRPRLRPPRTSTTPFPAGPAARRLRDRPRQPAGPLGGPGAGPDARPGRSTRW